MIARAFIIQLWIVAFVVLFFYFVSFSHSFILYVSIYFLRCVDNLKFNIFIHRAKRGKKTKYQIEWYFNRKHEQNTNNNSSTSKVYVNFVNTKKKKSYKLKFCAIVVDCLLSASFPSPPLSCSSTFIPIYIFDWSVYSNLIFPFWIQCTGTQNQNGKK